MAIPRDDLGGGILDRQAETVADVGLDLGRELGVGADGPRELPDRHGVAGPAKAVAVSCQLEGPAGELDAEGGGLGVDPVSPTRHDGAPVL